MSANESALAIEIGRFVAQLDRTALTDELASALKPAVLDCIAAILSGVSEPVSDAVRKLAARTGAAGEATIIGSDMSATVAGAALANGTMAHACDYDEVSWSVWGHATAPVLPAILATAELHGLSGTDFLVALAAGLEVSMQLGLRVVPEHYERGWHSTSTLGVFGAAAGSAKALGLDACQIAHALGIAASRASGLRENFGSMTKALHVGFANRDGYEAALFAKAGVTAAPLAIEGPYGFLRVMVPGQANYDQFIERLGKPFDILANGLTYKLYPSCGDTHAAVDAMLELRKVHAIEPDNVRRIYCGITPLAASNLTFHVPQTPLHAKFSTEFCLAVALARGNLELRDFTQERVQDSIIRSLIARTEVAVHPAYDNHDALRYSPAIVTVDLNDGQSMSKEVRIARGNPERPLSMGEMKDKFMACAELAIPVDAARRAIEMILTLEQQTSLRELMTLLGRSITRSVEARKIA